ncbi:proteoglycan 4b isoform X2 [Scomber japonicus]|uniref:proteoglycan 4b isoform X2 n=1 Tax=Scomber japonicus TaxID=13676 RepID=UPI002304EF10|nr:proteoglycan 4b isoform X2 [Scomber japonicus]
MPSTVFYSVIFAACAVTFSAAQTSCKGRCGGEYYRGYDCQCDYTCLSYGECCDDFESQCTTEHSCQGRCGESFKRGRRCTCDPDCVKFKQCCSDFKEHCDAEDDYNTLPMASPSSYPQDDLSDGEDPLVSPTPESTSGGGPSTADPLDQVTTQANGEAPTESADVSDAETTSLPDSGTTLPPASTEVQDVSSQPTTTSAPQTDPDPTANPPEPEPEPEVQAEDTDPTEAPTTTSDPPVASVTTELKQDSSTGSEDSQVATTSASITLDSTPIPEGTTSNPEPDGTEGDSGDATTDPSSSLPDLQDPSTDGSPAPELDSLTTHVPLITDAPQDDTKDDATPGETTADPLQVTPEPTKPQPSEPTSKPQVKPVPRKPLPTKPTPSKPISKPDTKPVDPSQTLNVDNPRDYQGDDSNDTNLCSGRPVSAVTTLSNGTIAVFRGHYFWFLDSNRVPGPARSITQVWGVPSPIDTVFTRCNCQGKTYIFKGNRYWRYENDVVDSGYPKLIESGFDGLRGHITAALSVPQYRRRREAVYFFKRGGSVQKYSYQFGTSPTCGRKVQQYTITTVRNRLARQAVSLLGPTISIRKSWTGFPSTITAAVSIPTTREPEGYKYYVFSKTKSYNIRMDAARPVVAPAPKPSTSPQSNDVFKCPKKV